MTTLLAAPSCKAPASLGDVRHVAVTSRLRDSLGCSTAQTAPRTGAPEVTG